eukprot:TRINITY_DN3335_c0_g1_i1.p1 TRINITY_DN3335_c0_g1~~TRINITY_DN3335_c0_g1_i1.p1  ORF type:complete len:268 (-),score=21.73 TRINITY_DN3335_c0_g1_i1:14-784(-)
MVKILFLDVDGVVNIPRGMDKGLLNNLKSIVDETGCKIVLSSDWRNAAQTRNEIRNILRSLGMDFISCTPPTRSLQNRRPEEILEWIETSPVDFSGVTRPHGGAGPRSSCGPGQGGTVGRGRRPPFAGGAGRATRPGGPLRADARARRPDGRASAACKGHPSGAESGKPALGLCAEAEDFHAFPRSTIPQKHHGAARLQLGGSAAARAWCVAGAVLQEVVIPAKRQRQESDPPRLMWVKPGDGVIAPTAQTIFKNR